ncbi:MAG: hypothetical protein DHS20C11_16180 [Lysobacteraceae bacterium]|nr:MAG: hypothetical protein DHS20C11_16180 [Xanthomonadaceae bacterium]
MRHSTRPRLEHFLILLASSMVFCSSPSAYEIFVSDAGGFNSPPWQILRYAEDGSNPQVFTNEQLGWPQDILFLPGTDDVLISNLTTSRINRHHAESGDFVDVFDQAISQPTRLAIGPDGLIYALQWSGDGLVKRYQRDGTALGNFTSVGISQAIGLDWDTNGNLYVSSFDQAAVHRFDSNGQYLGVFIQSNLQGPTNIFFLGDDLLVLDWTAGSIARFDKDGTFVDTFAAGLRQPEGIAELPDGNLLIGNGQGKTVREHTADGAFVANRIARAAGGLIQPNAVVIRSTGIPIDATISDSWVDPRYPSQGLLILAYPDRDGLFAGWYTFNDEILSGLQSHSESDAKALGTSDQRWLTAGGTFAGANADLTVFSSQGGLFNAAAPVAQTAAIGTMQLFLESCNLLRLFFEFDDPAISGEMQLQRAVDDNVAACQQNSGGR